MLQYTQTHEICNSGGEFSVDVQYEICVGFFTQSYCIRDIFYDASWARTGKLQ